MQPSEASATATSPVITELEGTPTRVLHLRRGGTSVVVDLEAEPTPAIIHWGAELADSSPESLASLAVAARPQRVSGGLDRTAQLTLVSTPAGGWLNTPNLEGHRDGAGFSARFDVAGVQANDHRALLSLSLIHI